MAAINDHQLTTAKSLAENVYPFFAYFYDVKQKEFADATAAEKREGVQAYAKFIRGLAELLATEQPERA